MDSLIKALEIAGPYIAGGVALISAVLSWVLKSERDRADISAVVSDVAQDWIEALKKQIDENEEKIRQQQILIVSQQEQINILTKKLNDYEQKVEEKDRQIVCLICGATKLTEQVVDLGEEPVWSVPKEGI